MAVSRALKGAGRKFQAAMASEDRRPSVFSPEGMLMLTWAVFFEIMNILLGFLDFVFGIGVFIAPAVNGAALLIIGSWLWMRTGSFPARKILVPFIGNSIPGVKFFPFWLFSVWVTLKK